MANRVLIGKKSTGVYGVFVSRPGTDVTTAAEDDLIFNTNNGSGALLGMFQFGYTSGSNIETSVTQSANTTSSQTVDSLGSNVGVVTSSNGGVVDVNTTTSTSVSITTPASIGARNVTYSNPSSVTYTMVNFKDLF